MGVLGEAWCFCSGGGRSEKIKGTILGSKGPAMARVCGKTGFLINRALLLTTHANLPSPASAQGVEIQLHCRRTAKLVPQRFFLTSSVLDLTVVGVDPIDSETSQQSHFLRTCTHPCLDLNSAVYLLGHSEEGELTVGEGKVVIATDNLIKLSTDGITWGPGFAGFDAQGNLAFMVCDPMKLASSPTTKSSSSSSSSSWKKELPTQFGIPIPVICHWLNQHWEGSLDDLNKPKMPLIRLMSVGQKSDHSSASFTLRRVFKSSDGDEREEEASFSHKKTLNGSGSSSASITVCREEPNFHTYTHDQGIPTPEIYESPRMTSLLIRKESCTQLPLLDINFPPKNPRSIVLPSTFGERNAVRESHWDLVPNPNEDKLEEHASNGEEEGTQEAPLSYHRDEVESGLVVSDERDNECCSEVESSCSRMMCGEEREGFLGDGECSSEVETMYSAETRESRNYGSPGGERVGQQKVVGRSQSCVSYGRWASGRRKVVGLEKQQSFVQGRKFPASTAASYRGRDYYSPTVSSIMKKRAGLEQPSRPRPNGAHLSPRWML
ncbi:hypothetical protein AMTRI_Chr06g172600 [Amborella trichopoda]